MTTAGAAIGGAGIAGVSTGYFLSVIQGVDNVVIVDPRPPLTLTSDKSTECYRNWWPNPSMVAFMDRSIDLLERLSDESDDAFGLNRRGYLYVHGRDLEVRQDGVEVLSGSQLSDAYPYLSDEAKTGVRVERAGWFSAQQLGSWMLGQAREHGLEVVKDEVVGIQEERGQVSALRLAGGDSINTGTFINAAGPMLARVGAMAGTDLPVHNEAHLKVAFKDTLRAVPRDAPMLIWADPQRLELTDEERSLCIREGRTDLLEELPTGCHCRPEGGPDSDWVLGLWEYHRDMREAIWPLPADPLYPSTVLRGLATMIPALSEYQGRPPESVVDGGYYTKTTDNMPLIGTSGIDGAFVCGGLSGYGVMAACAAGELAALHVTGATLPSYAAPFDPGRYNDPEYTDTAAAITDTGQI